MLETRKDWSLSEWVNNFLQDEGYYYDDVMYDDIYDDTMPGGDAPHYPGGEAEDDGLVDTMVIMGLALSLAFFVYYRQQRERAEQARRLREEQQHDGGVGGAGAAPAAAAQNNGGFFPPPGDPNFNQWVAGGVGH